MNVLINLLLVVIALYLTSCASGKVYTNPDVENIQPRPLLPPDFTMYALGDGGEINDQSTAIIDHLARIANDDQVRGNIIFLGDNIYPSGMPPESDKIGFRYAQDILMNQIHPLSTYKGDIIFIPGNHDWNEFHPGGLASIRRQGSFINSLNYPRISMIPENGCGGPVTFELNQNLVLLIADSQWWLQDWNKEPGINEDCPIKTREDFITAIHELIKTYKDKQIIFAMHHPLFTQGGHGGHFTVRDHLFPLSKVVSWLYIPLPVIGSIYPMFRSTIGHPQDIRHRGYKSLKEAILTDMDYPGEMIFLAGHDHNLQYITSGDDHFLLSGSVSKKNPIANHKNLVYGHKAGGFMQLDFFYGEGVFLTIYEINDESGLLETVFSRFIIEK